MTYPPAIADRFLSVCVVLSSFGYPRLGLCCRSADRSNVRLRRWRIAWAPIFKLSPGASSACSSSPILAWKWASAASRA